MPKTDRYGEEKILVKRPSRASMERWTLNDDDDDDDDGGCCQGGW